MPSVLVNADDFGLHRDIDRGILDCIDACVVQSVSFSPQGQSLDWQMLRDLHDRGVRVGLHVTLVGEPWLTDGRLIAGWQQLVKQLALPNASGKQLHDDVKREIDAQMQRCVDEQIRVAHIDSHQHVHAFSGVWEPVLATARQHNIPRVRVPRCPSWFVIKRTLGGVALQLLASKLAKRVGKYLPILGIAHAGANTVEIYRKEFAHAARAGAGDVELCVHPGHATVDLLKKYAEWNFDWRSERDALLDPQFRQIISKSNYNFAPLLRPKPATTAA